ncbi:NADH-quinone oxidoreductase subunit H [Nocardioides sp.]|jgi:NADH-quinone oxidoreductase subunit H|uniref:NADH-quinone oxidoreductase subunit H n=1 Tax=Nocardioides sp. TaxID=35761 RepID=UPI001D6BEC8D|nr:NADH-quinone oxidoreductase subunit H [Nocardioides sp.]MBU1801039.1 NADH-quinone oxidoreductase subunit H [Actinomycetota bacterium]
MTDPLADQLARLPAAALGAVLALGLVLVLAWTASVSRGVAAGRAVPASMAHAPAEAARLLRQGRRTTLSADRLLWRVGGWGLFPVAVLLIALVPVGETALLPGSLGVVWANALDVVVWALVWLLGWGANSVAGLVGGYRFLALALGYELPLMFALVAPAIAASSLDLAVVADAQSSLWYAVWMPVAFVAYLVGVLGFAVSGPLAAPVGSEVSDGALAELSGPDLLVVRAGRHALMGAGAAIAVPLFLGGGSGPWLPDAVWVVLKALLLTGALAWAAGRLPTLRTHQLMEPLWTILLPLVVLQDLVVAVLVVSGS